MTGEERATLLLILCLILVTIPEISTVKAEVRTIVVPDNYLTIQAAINQANGGDTITVKAGTYYENVLVNKSLIIESQSGAKNTIICNADTGSGKSIFEIWADNVEITGFTIRDSTNRTVPGDPFDHASYVDACGIYVGSSIGTRISRNIIRNNFEGIVFSNCSNIIISENQVTENIHEGVRIVYSSSSTLAKNNITRNHFPEYWTATALVIFHCTNSEISENQIGANDNGVVVSNSEGITFSNNSITDNRFHGLNLVGGQGHRLFGNAMRNNTYGICPSGSTNNQISENILQENDYGITFYGSSNNFIYHNYFINNSLQVSNFHGTESNSFDNDYPSGGNYWSDYDGTDNDRDGIGDVPYVIGENSRDNYPLMNPSSPPNSLSYELVVDSMPSGVTFTVDNVTFTTPWLEIYNETTSVSLVMPEFHSFEGENYIWWRWSDGNTNRIRTVTVNKSTALTGIFRPEDTSLIISVRSPGNKTYSTPDVPLEVTVNRIFYSTSYSLDGLANITIIGNTTLTGLSEGSHKLIVYIEDTPGNTRSSSIIHFTVDTSPPNITDVYQLQFGINGTIGVHFNTTVTDAINDLDWVVLNYTYGNGTWIICEMTNLDRDNWIGTLPAVPYGAKITYTIIAEDIVGNTITSEELFGYLHEYEVLPEFPSWAPLLIMSLSVTTLVFIYERRIQNQGRTSQ